jgi:hypothetical protein
MLLFADASLLAWMAIFAANFYAACWAWDRKSLSKRIDALEAKLKLPEPSGTPRPA